MEQQHGGLHHILSLLDRILDAVIGVAHRVDATDPTIQTHVETLTGLKQEVAQASTANVQPPLPPPQPPPPPSAVPHVLEDKPAPGRSTTGRGGARTETPASEETPTEHPPGRSSSSRSSSSSSRSAEDTHSDAV